MVLKMVIVWIMYDFQIVTLNLNKIPSFDGEVCIFLLLPRLGISLLILPREKPISSMVCNWYSDNISYITFIFPPAKGK